MEWSEAFAYWRQDMVVRHMSPDTERTWRSYLRRWGAWCAASGVDPMVASHRDVGRWIASNPRWSASCHKSARMALGSFYRLMLAEGEVAVDPMLRVPPVRPDVVVRVAATEAQVSAGLLSGDADARLMVGLAAECSLRRSEIARVHSRDLSDRGIVVRGKGRKDRWVPVCDEALWRDLSARRGWVFPGRFAGHVHPATVARRVRAVSGVSPHPHRRRYATAAYGAAHDLVAVQQLLGHASVATTQLYIGVPRERLRDAAGAAVARPGLRAA
jgi:site-specific recombinase XerD